jgi:hypothetical protein
VIPESKTTSAWLDSKGRAAYDANKLGGIEIGALQLQRALHGKSMAALDKTAHNVFH